MIGDDDTMFSPLALAQLLLGERYPSDDEWCVKIVLVVFVVFTPNLLIRLTNPKRNKAP